MKYFPSQNEILGLMPIGLFGLSNTGTLGQKTWNRVMSSMLQELPDLWCFAAICSLFCCSLGRRITGITWKSFTSGTQGDAFKGSRRHPCEPSASLKFWEVRKGEQETPWFSCAGFSQKPRAVLRQVLTHRPHWKYSHLCKMSFTRISR